MSTAGDIVDYLQVLSVERSELEQAWRDILELAFPLGGARVPVGGMSGRVSELQNRIRMLHSARRSQDLYDTTAMNAINVVSAGIESFVTPAGSKWHSLKADEAFAIQDASHEEKEWLDELNTYLFRARYDSDSGFASANTQAIRSVTALGTGVFMTESTEEFGKPITDPFLYTHIPVIECFMATDARNRVQTLYRWFNLTAEQTVRRYGAENVSANVLAKANDPSNKNQFIELCHAVQPRDEKGTRGNTNRDSEWASFVVEVDSKHIISEGGFFTFPYTVYTWGRTANLPYGETPVMALLGNIKSLNSGSLNTDIAIQQAVQPPLATADGDFAVDWNPGSINPGMLSGNGVQLFQAMLQNPRPDLALQYMQSKQAEIEKVMGVQLWSVLNFDGPQQTATEVMIRNQEKAQLLGPLGNIMLEAQSKMVETELSIIARRGAFAPGSPLAPPASMVERGADIQPEAESPYARALKTSEAIGVQQSFEWVMAQSQIDPSAADIWDTEEATRLMPDLVGAPAKILRTEEEVAQIRQQRQAAQAAQQTAQTAQQAGDAAQSLAQAQEAFDQSGLSESAVGDLVRQAAGGQ